MIVRKFTRDEWQQSFALAFMLHPSADVALQVVIDASWITTLLEQIETRRQRSRKHYKSPIPREALLQFAVFYASLRWERDQESPLPKMQPRYKPTRDDLVVRYLKHLVWNNLLKTRLRYLAIALGCLLYDYKPKQITDFLGLFDEPKIRNIKSRIKKQLMKRFVYADVLTPKGNAFRTKPASDHDRELLKDALKLLTPWNTAHITVRPGELLLAKMFADKSKLTNWDRKHVLLDPECGGLEQLVNEHNQLFGAGLHLADPKLKLFVPDFDDTPTPPVDRFKAPRLTDGEITLLNERRKRPGPRTYDVNDLLSDLYECGVDESLIEVLDGSASSTTESPPLRVLSHGSYAKRTRIRKQFVEEEGGAMERGTMIVVVVGFGALGTNFLSDVSEVLLEGSRPNLVLLMEPDPYPDQYIPYTDDIRLYPINGQIACECLPYLSWVDSGVVCSKTGSDVFVEKYDLTGWSFIERSISDDLIRHGTIRYPFTNDWEWRHYLIPRVPLVQDFFGWSWFDCPTIWNFTEHSISEDLIRHGTIRYPFTNIWERRHYLIPRVPLVQDFFGWSWFDCPTVWDFMERSISEDLIRHGTIRYPATNIWGRHYLIPGVPLVQDFFGWSWFDCPTVWDFMERSISEDLIRHGTIRYPFTNIWERRHYLIPEVPILTNIFGWSWFDDRKPEPSLIESSWIRLFCDDRERAKGYKGLDGSHGATVTRYAAPSVSPAYLKPNEPRGHSPSLNFEDSPFETQSPFRLTPPADGYPAVIVQHSVEDTLRKDLKPYVPNEELLVSDWYDEASTRRLQDGFLPYSSSRRDATRVKKTDARYSKAGTWGESSFPIWGIQMSANRASPETSADAI